ncbi:3-hydroxyacyl-CoA dehydrogenase/enoyl-CoA hydratase family protein [Natronomonas marina]|uniref:3-hydroxyacyl-CoA dehydrogenase/enoyl-CoA hydratase family protein n=1 Tax=Natronomonas marina TaxID=2961939 RepID=UPI0020CA0508|nr:3-hydroxyacyl-CoA dehydrogenase NAD-binding domain-containing protein [Natronomonas marina]
MTIEDIDRVAVLGAGSMGHGITEVVAIAGYQVTMRDVETDLVEDGYEDIEWSLEKLAEKDRIDEAPADVLKRIETTTDLESAVAEADLVIEAAPEEMEIKHDIFSDLDEMTPEDAILASNTSSLPITDIAAATDRPEQVVGTHFFNPPVKMDLVEVIYGDETSDATAETAYEFVESIDKTPIYVRKDVRGFVVNTVLGPFGDEAAWMVSEGVADIREVDATMVHERGYPMGPFELSDMTGIDIGYHVRKEAGQPVPPIVEEKVEADELGQKTGIGYYDYEHGDGADYVPEDAAEEFDWLRIEARIVNEAADLIGNDVATPEAIDTGLRLGAGFPEGPCRRADKIGLDTVLEKLETLHDEYGEERYEPSAYLRELVDEGRTGEDAGAGFYEYGDDAERDYTTINVELDDEGLLSVELDRTARMNALNQDMMDEIVHLLENADLEEVRAVTFEGAGDRAFSAGADITGFAGIDPHEVDVTPVFRTVNDFPRPTLAKIDGYCLGGGHELALACDLRVATENSAFGFPEIDLGLIPGGGGTQRAIRMLSEARAKELVFRGNRIDAETAEEWGLINRAVPADEFDDTVSEFVDDLVSGPPVALRKAKQVMNEGRDQDISAGLQLEAQAFGLLLSTDDMMEGAEAFMADREPEFEGK